MEVDYNLKTSGERFQILCLYLAKIIENLLWLACVAGVNGEGEGEREKNGVLRARDAGTPATKTPFFHLRPPIFM